MAKKALLTLFHRLPGLEIDAAHVRDLLNRREERRLLGRLREHLVQLALALLAERQLVTIGEVAGLRLLLRREVRCSTATSAFLA